MSGKIVAFSNGKIITFDKPIVSRTKKKVEDLPKEETIMYTFADAVTGFHVQATKQRVLDCLEQLHEEWCEMGSLAWSDLWWGIADDRIPMVSVYGGDERAYYKKDNRPIEGHTCALGWSSDYIVQMYGGDGDIDPEVLELKFELIWDDELDLFWITPNYIPIVGYMEY